LHFSHLSPDEFRKQFAIYSVSVPHRWCTDLVPKCQKVRKFVTQLGRTPTAPQPLIRFERKNSGVCRVHGAMQGIFGRPLDPKIVGEKNSRKKSKFWGFRLPQTTPGGAAGRNSGDRPHLGRAIPGKNRIGLRCLEVPAPGFVPAPRARFSP
jgi:hypothetical protein